MALLDTLRARAARKGGTAQVPCGALGTLTVEALSLAECARLGRNPRSLFYAACRELQTAGEALRQEGLAFRPDEVMESVTEEEAQLAAQAILALSGISPAETEDAAAEAFGETTAQVEAESDVPQQTETNAAEAAANLPFPAACAAAPEEIPRGTQPSLPSASESGAESRRTVSRQAAPAPKEHIHALTEDRTPVFETPETSPAPFQRASSCKEFSSQERHALAAEAAQILAQELRHAAMVR